MQIKGMEILDVMRASLAITILAKNIFGNNGDSS